MRRFRGFSGRDAQARALAASRRVNANPFAVTLADGSWSGVGELLLLRNGHTVRYLYGARGTTHVSYADEGLW